MGKEVKKVKVNTERKRVRFSKEFKLEAIRLLEKVNKVKAVKGATLDLFRKWQLSAAFLTVTSNLLSGNFGRLLVIGYN